LYNATRRIPQMQRRCSCHKTPDVQPIGRRLSLRSDWPTTNQPYATLVCRLMVTRNPCTYIGLLLIYRPRRDGRLSWPGQLTHSGHLTQEWSHANYGSGIGSRKVRQPKIDVLTTEPRRRNWPPPRYFFLGAYVQLLWWDSDAIAIWCYVMYGRRCRCCCCWRSGCACAAGAHLNSDGDWLAPV